METLPKIGTLIRCVGARLEAGAVTYNGHTSIPLPRRTDDGKTGPGMFDLYHLRQVGSEWIYELVQPSGRCEHCSTPVGGGTYSIVYLLHPDASGLDTRFLHTGCVAAFIATHRADIDSIEDIDDSGDGEWTTEMRGQ